MNFQEDFMAGLAVALAAIGENNEDSFSPKVSRLDSSRQAAGTAPHISIWAAQEDNVPSEAHGGFLSSLSVTGFVTLSRSLEDPRTTDEHVIAAKHDVMRAIMGYLVSASAGRVEMRSGLSLSFTPSWELDREEPEIGFEINLQVSFGISWPDLGLVNPS